ncbi:hypothetical protein [Actinoplanes sp. NPDC051494]|uniref:hypothetical protein n=1 Tax=Actinoplanes sp. NPDC051494 TaxID=3363907 RepID=UPI00379B803C
MRGYRLLVRAYPPGPRRDELLDTMVMAAEAAGRTAPRLREVVDVLRHAPRARLGRPGSRSVVFVALTVALLAGFATASLGARLFGETGRPLPTASEMSDIAALVTPGTTAPALERRDALSVNGNGEARFGYVRYEVDRSTAMPEPAGYYEEVAARLTAAGWRTGPGPAATKDGLVLTMVAWYNDGLLPASGGTFEVEVRRAEPAGMPLGFAAGWLLGMVAGWLYAGWASRRIEHVQVAGVFAGLLTLGAAVSLLPAVVQSLRDLVAVLRHGTSYGEGPLWGWAVPFGEMVIFTGPALIAVLGAVIVVALCKPPRAGGRGMAVPGRG